jgi:hypothetical protein
MAWRPTPYLLEGELDNTTPGKVTGWMRFAGMKDKVTFDLKGDFHRDIRGTKIRLSGDGQSGGGADREEAVQCMEGFAPHQTGNVGDITAGLPPRDYVPYPYCEWFGDDNGRVVIELEPEQVTVIGTPIPWQESDPISRQQQQQHMASFIASISQATQAPAVALGAGGALVSDPSFSHWVVVDGQIVGEAHSVEVVDQQMSAAFVRLFNMPDMAESGHILSNQLRGKEVSP